MAINKEYIPIDNQPTIKPRTVTGIFTKYIAKTLPLAFDESMSYYECLCALLEYLNETIVPDINNTNEGLSELQNFYLELQEYVNTYFDNLDVQEEINNKLDKMAISGELTQLISTYINPFIEEQNKKINNQYSIIADINKKVQSATNYNPLIASNVSEMTDTDRIYVNTSNGNWYYYNGNSWVSGGVYQSSTTNDIINEDTSLYNNQKISSNGIKLYGHDMLFKNLVITPVVFTVNYRATQSSYFYELENNKYYVIKKLGGGSRFRVGLIKNLPNFEEEVSYPEIAKIICDDNNATVCAFNSNDYNYVVVLVNNSETTTATCTIFNDNSLESSGSLFLTLNNKNINDYLKKSEQNFNNTLLWELGNINNQTGVNVASYNHIRTKTFIDTSILNVKRIFENSLVTVGLRIYNLDGSYNSSLLLSNEMFDIPLNHKYYKYRLIMNRGDQEININVCNYLQFISIDNPLTIHGEIDINWEGWEDVRNNYGFNINTTPIPKTIDAPLESNYMMSVRGGKGRWSDTFEGGHVFEGWNKEETFRFTELIGKFGPGFSCIQTYSPAGLYETNRRFGWVKVGSDNTLKGVDFSEEFTKFYTSIILPHIANPPTRVTNADLNPQLSDYQNSIPIGTLYYNSTVNKIGVYTNTGWKYLKFED